MYKIFLTESKKTDVLKRLKTKFPKFEKLIERAIDSDPTGNRYIPWIESNLNNLISKLEDTNQVEPLQIKYFTDYLGNIFESTLPVFANGINRISPKLMEKFKNEASFKNQIIPKEDLEKILKSPRDIFSYNLLQLEVLANTLEKNLSEKQKEKKAKADTDFIYDDGNTIVVQAKTHKASCYYGANTKWCTTSESPKYFEKYTSEGNLYYVIDKKNRKQKVAVFIPRDKKRRPEIYDTQDTIKNMDFLFKLYPEVEDTFDNLIGTYESLKDLKRLKNGEISTRDAINIDELIADANVRYDDPKSIDITLEFDGDKDFWKLWDDNIDDYNKAIIDSAYSHYPMDLFDISQFESDWDDGYAFYWFDDTQIERLTKYMKILAPKLDDCLSKLKTRDNDECAIKVADFLKTTFNREVDDIISEYGIDRESDAYTSIREELDSNYSNMFAKYGMPMVLSNFYKGKVTLNGILELYKKFDPVGKLSIFELLKTIVEQEGIDLPNIADNLYEYSNVNYFYSNTYNAIEKLLNSMEEHIDENLISYNEEYFEFYEMIKKLGGVGNWFQMPGDERYDIAITEIDPEEKRVSFILRKKTNKYDSKKMRLPFENFKDFLYNQLLFDI